MGVVRPGGVLFWRNYLSGLGFVTGASPSSGMAVIYREPTADQACTQLVTADAVDAVERGVTASC